MLSVKVAVLSPCLLRGFEFWDSHGKCRFDFRVAFGTGLTGFIAINSISKRLIGGYAGGNAFLMIGFASIPDKLAKTPWSKRKRTPTPSYGDAEG